MKAMPVSDAVLRILDRSRCDGSILALPEQLDRPAYQAVDKVLQAAGGRWDRRAGGHRFEGQALDAIEPILLTGTVVRTKQEFGQFYTPREVADRVIALADIRSGHAVLEPSAGRGALALPAAAAGGRVFCYEVDRRNAEALAAASLKAAARLDMVVLADFLTVDPRPLYDRVVMNPPFGRQAELLHVRHAAAFIKPGGRLVAVMPDSVAYRSDPRTTAFRAFLADHSGTFEPLPEGAFRASGTAVRTVLVDLQVPA